MYLHTYIIYSNTLKKYYTGHTADLQKRLEEHNRGKTTFRFRDSSVMP